MRRVDIFTKIRRCLEFKTPHPENFPQWVSVIAVIWAGVDHLQAVFTGTLVIRRHSPWETLEKRSCFSLSKRRRGNLAFYLLPATASRATGTSQCLPASRRADESIHRGDPRTLLSNAVYDPRPRAQPPLSRVWTSHLRYVATTGTAITAKTKAIRAVFFF